MIDESQVVASHWISGLRIDGGRGGFGRGRAAGKAACA
jgi:hypothetical protein